MSSRASPMASNINLNIVFLLVKLLLLYLAVRNNVTTIATTTPFFTPNTD